MARSMKHAAAAPAQPRWGLSPSPPPATQPPLPLHLLPSPPQEEEFWGARLAALTKPSQQLSMQPPRRSSDAAAACIPVYLPPASPAQLALSPPPQEAAGALMCPPAGPADALVQQAQVEALKLQVAQLRRSNAHLQQQVAAAAAERAAAAKAAALQRLAELRLPGHAQQDVLATPAVAVNEGAIAATLAALKAQLGVQLQPEADCVPLGYLLQLFATSQSRLAELKQQHEAALRKLQEEQEKQLQMQMQVGVATALPLLQVMPPCLPPPLPPSTPHWICPPPHLRTTLLQSALQAEQAERQLRMLTEGLEDPAREAEVRLLRDDCRYLKVCGRQLAAGCSVQQQQVVISSST